MKRKQYDESFKSEAVKLALSGELSYAEIARDLGVNYGTLTNWIYTTMSNPKPDKPSNTSKPSSAPQPALRIAISAARVNHAVTATARLAAACLY